jgi:hypothetical protein
VAVDDVLSSRTRYIAVEEHHICIAIASGPNSRCYEVVGTGPLRHDGVEKVTGQDRCVEGQMQGGSAQDIGWVLHEEYLFNERGHVLNGSFLDYHVPVCLDPPMIETVLVEVLNPNHPYGVRGVGEVPIVPPMATIANAIYRAIGLRFNQLPRSPGRVLEALVARRSHGMGHTPTRYRGRPRMGPQSGTVRTVCRKGGTECRRREKC